MGARAFVLASLRVRLHVSVSACDDRACALVIYLQSKDAQFAHRRPSGEMKDGFYDSAEADADNDDF